MKVIGFVGSPRKKGNTTTLVNEVLRGASDAGAETKIYNLNTLNIRGCQGCYKCQAGPEARCIQKDDMTALYDDLYSADAIVLGSPVYMFQVTAQTKTFTDRLFALLYLKDGQPGAFRNKLKDKKAVTVYSQGQADLGFFAPSFDINEGVLGFVGFKLQGRVAAGGMTREDAARNNPEILEKAYKAGAALVK